MVGRLLTFVLIIINSVAFSQVYNQPATMFNHLNYKNPLELNYVEVGDDYTKLNITYKNDNYGWINISENSFLVTSERQLGMGEVTKYKFKRAEGIMVAPLKTYMNDAYAQVTFNLYFDKIPDDLRNFHFIEESFSDDTFKLANIDLDTSRHEYNTYLYEAFEYLPLEILHLIASDSDLYDYQDLFEMIKSQTKDNQSPYRGFRTAERDGNKYFRYTYKDTRVTLEYNMESKGNKALFLIFEDSYDLNRVQTILEYLYPLVKGEGGNRYTIENRFITTLLFDYDKLIMTYYSLGW